MSGPPVEDARSRAERPDPVPAAERGSTVVADLVVAKIAARAAHEALAPLPPGVLPPEATAVVLLPPAREVRAGENPAGTARIQVGVELGYPTDIGLRCAAVRRRVAERVGALTGMAVHEVAVQVERLHPSPAHGRTQ